MSLNDSVFKKASFVPYDGGEDYIFISYAHKDSEYVIPVLERMNSEGYRIWYDDGIMPGSEWPEFIAEHLKDCAAVISFISPESINSHNCRREMTYAMSKKKPFLGIFLRETSLSPGVEMQLSAQQCILKYSYEDDERFYRKLFSSTVLHSSKRPEDAFPKAKAAEEPPAEKAFAEELSAERASVVEPSAEKASAEQPSKIQADRMAVSDSSGTLHPDPGPGKEKRVKIPIIKIIIVIIGLVLAAVAISNHISSERKAEEKRKRAEEYERNARIAAAAVPSEVFFGKRIMTESSFSDVQRALSMSQKSGEDTLDLVAIPYSMEVDPDTPDIMYVEFQDKFEHVFRFASRYELSEGVLTLTPPGEIETEEGISPLSDSMQYSVSVTSAGEIKLQSELESGKSYGKYTNTGTTDDLITLQGTACSPKDMYKEIASFDYSGSRDEVENGEINSPCRLFYENGGYSLNAYVTSLSTGRICIKVLNEMVAYNGYMQETECEKSLVFAFINTYPYGFIIKDDNDYYLYQDQVMSVPADQEDQ